MNLRRRACSAVAAALFLASGAAAELRLTWEHLPAIPDPVGLGGAYGGTSHRALIVAGGSNFPGKMPWDGGIKEWYDKAYVLEKGERRWQSGFSIPFAAGYGLSLTVKQGVLCAGGSDTQNHLASGFLLVWKGHRLTAEPLPSLPIPLAYSCGAVMGHDVYIVGGTLSPKATAAEKCFFRLNMKHLKEGWQAVPPWPGPPRMLACAAAVNGSLLLMGGADLHPDANGNPERTYLKDSYRFDPDKGWSRIPDMPNPVAAAPTPAPVALGRYVLVIGGDDGSLINFEPRALHPGFPKRVLCYDTRTGTWSVLEEAPFSRATLPTAIWRGKHVLISGEAKPGIRSPQVWAFRAKNE